MPGLLRDLAEHKLKIKEGFKLFQQPPWCFFAEVQLKINEEIILVLKKIRDLRVCTYYWNMNLATSKDVYLMPMADLLVDGASKYELLSFMDDNTRYNQIFIVEEDV